MLVEKGYYNFEEPYWGDIFLHNAPMGLITSKYLLFSANISPLGGLKN
jgi:hypothetical protein